MSEITEAIEAKQTQITQLQSDIETLQRAASIMGGSADEGSTRRKPLPRLPLLTISPRPHPSPRPHANGGGTRGVQLRRSRSESG